MGKVLGRGIRALIRTSDEDKDESNPDEVRYHEMRKEYDDKRKDYNELNDQIQQIRKQISLSDLAGTKSSVNTETLGLLESELVDIKKDLDEMQDELKKLERNLKTDDGLDLVAVSPEFMKQKAEREKEMEHAFESVANIEIPEIGNGEASKDEKLEVLKELKNHKSKEINNEILSMLKDSVSPTVDEGAPTEIECEEEVELVIDGETTPDDDEGGDPVYSLTDEELTDLSETGLIPEEPEEEPEEAEEEDGEDYGGLEPKETSSRDLELSIHDPESIPDPEKDEDLPEAFPVPDTIEGEFVDPRDVREEVYEEAKAAEEVNVYAMNPDLPTEDEVAKIHEENVEKARTELAQLTEEERQIREEAEDAGSWEELHDRGFAMARIGEFDKAIIYYNMALELNAESEELYSNKGVALYSMGKYEEAKDCFGNAIRINPQYEQAWNNMGVVMRTENKPKEAIRCYTAAIKANPKYKNAWYNLGFIMEDQGLLDKALWYYNKALDINPKYEEALYSKKALLVKLRAQGGSEEPSAPEDEDLYSTEILDDDEDDDVDDILGEDAEDDEDEEEEEDDEKKEEPEVVPERADGIPRKIPVRMPKGGVPPPAKPKTKIKKKKKVKKVAT